MGEFGVQFWMPGAKDARTFEKRLGCDGEELAFHRECNRRDRQESRLAWGSSLSNDEAGEDRPARQSLRGFHRLVRGRHNLRNASPTGILEHDLIVQSDPRAAVAEKLEDYEL